MKYLTLLVALALSACGGFESKQEFMQDRQNMEKDIELRAKFEKTPGCDSLQALYDFEQKQSPTTDDLKQILPLLGLTTKDANDIDKIYKIDYSVVDKYNCENNATDLHNARTNYCRDKYYDEYWVESLLYLPYRTIATASIVTIYGAAPFVLIGNHCRTDDLWDKLWHPGNCNKELDCEKYLIEDINYTDVNKDTLKQNLETKIKNMFPQIETDNEYLLQEFKISELLKAQQTALDGTSCDKANTADAVCDQVTKLSAANILYYTCVEGYYYNDRANECACFAHRAYQKLTYKNFLYVQEQAAIPQSKRDEFSQIFRQCEQKIKQQRQKEEKDRYGESVTENDANNNVLIEALENAAWAHRTLTDARKAAENE